MDNLTWEYLFGALDRLYDALQKSGFDMSPTAKRIPRVETVMGLRAVLPQLHAHPELHEMIPYMGVTTFFWWPAEDYRLALDTWDDRDKYHIVLSHGTSTLAETIVPMDKVIGTLLDFVDKTPKDTNPD